ncbi:alpha/beta hydrolase family protein [bacterium]|nr:alpha/beta hydrolase family protein [bacterium]
MDRAARFGLSRLPLRKRVFYGGWGDRDLIDWYLGIAATIPEVPAIDVTFVDHPGDGEMTAIQDLTYVSPAPHLPERSRIARARVIGPADGANRYCVLMASWNDEDYRTRTGIADLLADRGIASIIPENPLYGRRRVAPPKHQAIATVAEFGVMGRAAVIEGLALAAHFSGPDRTIGVSGYSMGGNLAAFVAASSPEPIAVAPLGAAYTPAAPFLDGSLRLAVEWEALGGEDFEPELREFLIAASVLDFPPPLAADTAVLIAGTIDGYIPAASVLAIHRHWPGSDMVWINTGHGALLRHHTGRLAESVSRAFDRFESREHSHGI